MNNREELAATILNETIEIIKEKCPDIIYNSPRLKLWIRKEERSLRLDTINHITDQLDSVIEQIESFEDNPKKLGDLMNLQEERERLEKLLENVKRDLS